MSKFRRIKHSLNIKKAIFSRDFVTFAAKFGDAVPVLPEEYRILFRENKIIMKISKNRYLQGFGIVVLLVKIAQDKLRKIFKFKDEEAPTPNIKLRSIIDSYRTNNKQGNES